MADEKKRLFEENERLKQELAEATILLDAILEHVPVGLAVVSGPDNNIRRVSKSGLELIGLPKEDVEGVPCEEHAKDWTPYHAAGITPASGYELPLQRAALKGEVTVNEEWHVKRPDGSSLTVLCNAGPIRCERGSITGGIITWQDITEHKRTEKTLQEKAEWLDLANDSIMVRDLDDRILFWNAGAETSYGWTKEEAIGKSSHSLLQTKFPKSLEKITEELFLENRWEGELIHVKNDGNQIVVESRWALLKDEHGRPKATLEIDTDISGRKLMEKQLEEKSNRLQDVNAALKVLLKHREEDRRGFEEALLINIENLIMPYLKRMKTVPLSSTQAALLEVVESHLGELTSQFSRTLAMQYRVLTPTEMRVAALVRDGKTSKEIADLLCISEKTASFHRNNIRTKLGLRGSDANLRSHLLSLT